MPTIDEIKSAVEAYARTHSACDTDGVVALFAEDTVVADPVDKPEMVGREALREFFGGTHSVAEKFDLQITGPIRAVGNTAAVPLRALTTMGGTTVQIDIIDVFTFDDDGLISDMRAYWTESDIQFL